MKDAVDNRSDMARAHPTGGAPEGSVLKAMALASEAATGHFNELRGAAVAEPSIATASVAPSGPAQPGVASPPAAGLTPAWTQFFAHLDTDGPEKLDQRAARLERQVRDNGVTYNVYADESGPQRPWSLDLFPMLVEIGRAHV